MTSSAPKIELVREVIPVILLKEIIGSVEGPDGERVREVYSPGRTVLLYNIWTLERLRPRTSSALSQAEKYVETKYSLKEDRGTWTPYVVRPPYDTRYVPEGQMIPHLSIAKTAQSRQFSNEFFKSGDRVFVLQEVECKNTKAPNGKFNFQTGDRVMLKSGAKTLKGGTPKNKGEAHYQYQALMPSSPLPKIWKSDGFFEEGVHFQRLTNN